MKRRFWLAGQHEPPHAERPRYKAYVRKTQAQSHPIHNPIRALFGAPPLQANQPERWQLLGVRDTYEQAEALVEPYEQAGYEVSVTTIGGAP